MENPSYLLTDIEKERFIWWLQQQVLSSSGKMGQFEKLYIPSKIYSDEKVHKEACIVILERLQQQEPMTIG